MRVFRRAGLWGALCAIAATATPSYAATVADTFDDGVVEFTWSYAMFPYDPSQFFATESGGLLHVAWPIATFDGLHLVHNLRAQGGVLTVSVDVDKRVGGVSSLLAEEAGLALLDGDRRIDFVAIGGDWYRFDRQDVSQTAQYLGAVGAPAGVTPGLHRMTVTYDFAAGTLTYAADGVALASEVLPLRDKLLVGLYAGPSLNTAEAVFDNFEATYTPAPTTSFAVSETVLGDVAEPVETAEDVYYPSWRPDGRQLAFYRRTAVCPSSGVCPAAWNLQVLDVPVAGPPRTIATAASGVSPVVLPSFSADGTRVFFTSALQGAHVANADGSGVQPFWPPQPTLVNYVLQRGDFLYFGAYGFPDGNHIRRIPAAPDGTPLASPGGPPSTDIMADSTVLVAIPNLANFLYDVSPDGSMLATVEGFGSRELDVRVYTGVDAIVQTPPAGDFALSPIRSESDPRVVRVAPGAEVAVGPAFSLTQERLYFTATLIGTFCNPCAGTYGAAEALGDQNWEIAVYDMVTGAREFISPALTNEGLLRPSPDGTLIAFNRAESLVAGPSDLDGDGTVDVDLFLANLIEQGTATAGGGGTVTDGSGSGVSVPGGAVDADTDVTVTTPLPGSEPDPSALPAGSTLLVTREVGPAGLTFNEPVAVTIHYTEAQIAGHAELGLQIFVWDPATGQWYALPTIIDPVANTAVVYVLSTGTFALVDPPPNQPPVADAGADRTVECSGAGAATVTLDGTGSTDPDGAGDIASYVWSEGGSVLATGSQPDVALALGAHTLTLEVTDTAGATDTAAITITVADTAPPTITAPADVVADCADAAGTAVALGAPVAADLCGGVTVVNDAPALFPLGTTVVTWTATDGTGHTATAVQTVTVRLRVEGLQAPLGALVPEGTEPVPLPDKAFKQHRAVPMRLELFCGALELTDADVAAPRIVGLQRTGDPIDLETTDLDAGNSGDGGVAFRYEDGAWTYNLGTANLAIGNYRITLEMPDGVRYQGAFVLR